MMRNRIRGWLTNVGLATLSVFISIFLLEVILRLTAYQALLHDSRNSAIKNYYTVSQPYQNIVIAPNRPKSSFIFSSDSEHEIWSNNIGCFDKTYMNSPYTIYLAGDSFTWGYTAFEKKYGTLIEKHTGNSVIKAGVGATGTRSQFYRAKKITQDIGFPKLLIVGYYIGNDVVNDYLFPELTVEQGYLVPKKKISEFKTGEITSFSREEILKKIGFIEKYGVAFQVKYPAIHKIKLFFNRNSILWVLCKKSANNLLSVFFDKRKKQLGMLDMYSNLKWFEDAYLKNFESIKMFKQFCIENNIKLLFVLIPEKYQVYPFFTKHSFSDLEHPNRRLRKFFIEEDILFLDLLPAFKQKANQTPRKQLNSKKDLYWRYDSHWNENGNLLAGLLISKFILENNLIDVENKNNKLNFIHNKLKSF